MADCRVSNNCPIETITLDDSSDEAPSPVNLEDRQTTTEQTDANRSSDSCVSSLNYCSDFEQPQNKSDEPIQKTIGVPNASQTSRLLKEPSFVFGPYVPIFRKENDVFIDPRGIIRHYYESNPTTTSKRLACEVLPDDTIADAPSFVTPLLLKKKTTLPPIESGQSCEQVPNDDVNKQHSNQNSENASTSQIFNSSNDIQTIRVIKQTAPLNKIADKNVNHKPLDDYIKSTCVASLTSARRGGAIQTISTLQDYYKSSVGELLLGIGLSRVRETCLQDNSRRLAQKIRKKGDDCDAENYQLFDVVKEQLSQTMASNKVFKTDNVLKCPRCAFKTEFAVVLDGHLETPHVDKKDYLCNWCEYKTNDSASVAYHFLVEHKRRCRIEKPPALHLCPWCPFECKDKRRMNTHVRKCEELFNLSHFNTFLGPQDYGENEFPAVTSKLINQEDIKAYENTLKTLRLAAYNPHQLKISGLQQTSNQPIILVQRQNGPLPSAYVTHGAPMNFSDPMMTKDQLANADYIANQNNRKTQLMQLLSGQNPNTNLLRGGTLQYPKTQSPFINGNSVFRTTSDFVMAPNHQPLPNMGTTQAVNTTDLMKELDDVQIANQPNSEPAKSTSSNPKGSTFVICEICDGYIKDLGQLKSHMQWSHKVKLHQKMLISKPPLNCQKCQWRFFTDQGLERHLLGAHGLITSNMQELVNKGSDSGRCTVCGRAYDSKLVAHMKEVHKLNLKPAHLTYKCTVCSATFNLYKLFENHVYSVHSDSVRRISGN